MTICRSLIVAVPLVAGLTYAQAGPGVSRAEAPNKAFSTLASPGNCYLQQLKGDAPGVYTAAVTSGSTLIIGQYDRVNQTWKPTAEAAALNPNSGNFGLMLESQGKYCVFDRADGVYFSARSGPGVAFPAPVKVNAALSGYVDPALAWLGGKLQLIWTTGTAIMMQELDVSVVTAPKVVGTATTIANRLNTSGSIHSPTPVNGPDGDIEALYCAESTGTDMYFKPNLDPTDKTILLVDNTTWSNNGGIAGASFLYVRSGAVRDIEAAYLTGDVEAPGGTVDLGSAAPSSKGKALTIIFLSDSVIAPLTLKAPFNVGALGINPNVFIQLGAISQNGPNEYGSMSFKLPSDPTLKGKSAPVQGLSFDVDSTFPYTWVWTNTASIVIN